MNSFAKIAREVYRKPNERARQIDDYILDTNENFNEYIAIYKNDKYTVISHRGTSSANQVGVDASLALGFTPDYISKRVNETANIIQRINANESRQVLLLGHSLVGHIAVEALRDPEINRKVSKVITFNIYSVHGNNSRLTRSAESKIDNYVIDRDIASAYNRRGNTFILKPQRRVLPYFTGTHSIEQFIS